jgi:hypothetical protein
MCLWGGKITAQAETLLKLFTCGGLLCWASRTYAFSGKRGRHEKRPEEAVHTIVASDWSEQQQDYNLLPQTLRAGNVNIMPVAIGAVFKRYSEHGFIPDDINDGRAERIVSR